LHTVLIQGHRGARGHVPENTLPGFTRALAIGVDVLEMDLGLTADNQLVVFHDRDLNPDLVRRPDGSWLPERGPALWSMTLDTLRAYDVGRARPGSDEDREFPDREGLDGVRIPTLSELISLVESLGHPSVELNLEIKTSPDDPSATATPKHFAEALATVLKYHDWVDRAYVQSFDWRGLQHLAQELPDLRRGYCTSGGPGFDTVSPRDGRPSPWLGGLDPAHFAHSVPATIAAAGGHYWCPDYSEIDIGDVQEAHQQGLKVMVWTVNETPAIERMVKAGVDGIISDYPDRVHAVLDRFGYPRPAPSPATAVANGPAGE
jgi:glycerophosphoryl diester phosphodiesterase